MAWAILERRNDIRQELKRIKHNFDPRRYEHATYMLSDYFPVFFAMVEYATFTHM